MKKLGLACNPLFSVLGEKTNQLEKVKQKKTGKKDSCLCEKDSKVEKANSKQN